MKSAMNWNCSLSTANIPQPDSAGLNQTSVYSNASARRAERANNRARAIRLIMVVSLVVDVEHAADAVEHRAAVRRRAGPSALDAFAGRVQHVDDDREGACRGA